MEVHRLAEVGLVAVEAHAVVRAAASDVESCVGTELHQDVDLWATLKGLGVEVAVGAEVALGTVESDLAVAG
jgi:hypothetical protein